MPIPIDNLSEDEYVKKMYAHVTRGIGIYRHLPVSRLLNAKWIKYKDFLWVSDFGGLASFNRYYERIPILPILIAWHKGNTIALTYNCRDHRFIPQDKKNDYINVASLVYKLFNGYKEDFEFNNYDTKLDFYNGIVYDCRVENISITNTYNYGVGYNAI